MNYYILTLFPEIINSYMGTSIMGKAAERGQICVTTINIRDFANNKHNKVDDYPYGGGAGMVMQPEPIYNAFLSIKDQLHSKRVIYLTPQGRVFKQSVAKELASEQDLVFLCGHYEGIDERVLDLIVTDYISIGDYILTGGELPALSIMDAVSRLVPGVLNNSDSSKFESFHENLLEYPQYTRPEEFKGMCVPDVLLSGHHKRIDTWRREQSILRTANFRPDLLKQAKLTIEEKKNIDFSGDS